MGTYDEFYNGDDVGADENYFDAQEAHYDEMMNRLHDVDETAILRVKSREMATEAGVVWIGLLRNPRTGGYLGATCLTEEEFDLTLRGLAVNLEDSALPQLVELFA